MGVVLGLAGLGVAFALMSGAQARIMAVFVMATLPLAAISALTIALQARLRPELVIIPALVQNVLWLAVVLVLGAGEREPRALRRRRVRGQPDLGRRDARRWPRE